MPGRLRRAVALLALTTTLMTGACGGNDDSRRNGIATTTTATIGRVPRTVTITGIALGVGDSLGIEMHPDVSPIAVHTSTPQLEVCPPGPSDRLAAWPRFDRCVQFDSNARLTLPKPTGVSHLGWRLRAPGNATARDVKITISYVAVDRHFVVVPPRAEPLALRVMFTPTQSVIVGASTLGPDLGFARNGAQVHLVQDGQPLLAGGGSASGVEGNAIFTVAIGKPLTASLRARGVAMLLEWL